VALASLSKQAGDFADAKGNIRLLDGDALLDLLLEHYAALRQTAARSCASGQPGIV
jgi:hypothetical protein